MKFRVNKGTKLFDQLVAVGEQIRDANNAAVKFGKSLGFSAIRIGGHVLAGGISSFQSETVPDGFIQKNGDGVFPRKNLKKNKEVLAQIEALPKVEHSVLNKVLKFDPFNSNEKAQNGNGSFKIQWYPHVAWKSEYVLVEVAEYMNYKPLKDMIEITASEYEKLSKKKNKKVGKQ